LRPFLLENFFCDNLQIGSGREKLKKNCLVAKTWGRKLSGDWMKEVLGGPGRRPICILDFMAGVHGSGRQRSEVLAECCDNTNTRAITLK